MAANDLKHIYWLTREEEADLGAKLKDKGTRLKHAKGVVCTPLDVLTRIAAVDPEVWSDHCPQGRRLVPGFGEERATLDHQLF